MVQQGWKMMWTSNRRELSEF